MRFFLDNNMSPKIAKALHELCKEQNHVVCLRDMFSPATPDVEWISALSEDQENEWVVITLDRKIRRNPHEEEVWREAGLPTYFLTKGWSKLRFWDQARNFVKLWPSLLEHAARAEEGSSYRVTQNCKIE